MNDVTEGVNCRASTPGSKVTVRAAVRAAENQVVFSILPVYDGRVLQ